MAGPPSRLFIDYPLTPQGEIHLDGGQAHYLANVLRRREGDKVLLFNGRDGEWEGEITGLAKKMLTLRLSRQTRPQTAEPGPLLAFAPVKRAPIDQIAQKAAELGAAALQPVFTARTIVTRVNEERLLANLIEAAEQSERLSVPTLAAPAKLSAFLGNWPLEAGLVFCDEELAAPGGMAGAVATLSGQDRARSWAILTGPEGGFTPEEREAVSAHPGACAISLGPRILKADTAAFAALTLFQAALGAQG